MPDSNSAKQTHIDLNARQRFEREIHPDYAGIRYLDSMDRTVKSIAVINLEFRNGKRGPRDATRAKLHSSASKLSNRDQRGLSVYLELDRHGKLGSCAPNEIMGETIQRLTGGACSERTFRRIKQSLCQQGWLESHPVPTGTRVLKSNGVWTTNTVNKITLTAAARLLNAKTYISLPRPKRPTTERDKRERGDVRTIPSLSLSDKTSELDRRARVVEGKSKESPKGDNATRPPAEEPPKTVKHKTSTSASRKAARKAAASAAPVSARKKRTKSPRTWQTGRRTLLAELFAFFHDDPHQNELYRIAQLQTDPHYPSVMLAALDWDSMVRRWLQMDWHDRRRCLKNEISPPLRAFCAYLSPPTDETREKFLDLASWLQVIPDKLPVNVPSHIGERMEREKFRINALIRQIHVGRANLADLTPSDHELLKYADFFPRWG